MTIESFITLPYALERDPPPFEGQDIKYPEALVRYFLGRYTRKGDKIFDPFAGLGTTLFVAEEMGRVPYGIESDPDRHSWSAGQLENWMNLLPGDAAQMRKMGFPKMDFSITSPPFMRMQDRWNPLYGGDPTKAGYAAYLRRLRQIYAALAQIMKRHALVVVHVDNIQGRIFTPLAWDMARVIAGVMKPAGEVIIKWENGPVDYPFTRTLIFKNSL